MKELFKKMVCEEFTRRWTDHQVADRSGWKTAWEAVVDDVWHQFTQEEQREFNAELGLAYSEAMCFEDNVRVCDNCGRPMIEGYYLGGEFACCEECCLALYGGDKAQMEEDLSHAEEDDCETYWTSWDGNYFLD